GDFCDANPGPGYTLGQIIGCACTPVVCTTNLNLVFQSDGTSNTGWEIHQQGSNVLVQSGGGIFPPSPGYSEATCLPNGDFYLVVTDDLGDGITGGGYILKTSSGSRIIDNRNNFSTGFTSQIAGGEGFTIPLGTDRLIFTSCDKLDWRTTCGSEYITANDNPLVSAEYGGPNAATSGYQMWWFDPNGGYSFRKFQSHTTSNGLPASATRACGFKINNWVGNQLQQGVLYNVKVRGKVADVWNNWGAACRFKVDNTAAACPLTKLMDIPGNQYFSCGATRPVGTTQASLVHARPVTHPNINCVSVSANRYQFRFRIVAANFVLIKTSATGNYFVNT
ncbi:MAG TPA: hypothetical protein PK760_16635, partial [Flavobacteriales bacterium]|nr:hypothetical protein [Flavobacteriales bacterium]